MQFKHILFAISVLMVSGTASFGKPSTEEGTYRFATFNLRYNSSKDKDARNWNVRKEFVRRTILDGDYDVAGLVEVSQPSIKESLDTLLGDDYSFYICGRHDGGNKGEGVGIIYKKSKFTVQDCGYFWLNENPDQRGVPASWVNPPAKIGARLVTWARMKDNTSGKEFFYFVAHFYLNAGARTHSSQLVIDKCKVLNPDGLPVFFCGDLNAREHEESMSILRKYFKDSYQLAQKKKKRITSEGGAATYNSFKANGPKDDMSKRIDYIYFRGKVNLKRYCVDYTTYSNPDYQVILSSDHYPVYVDVTF